MRILQLCNKPPYPPIDGGAKAMLTLTKGLLNAGHSVKVLFITTPKQPLDLATMPPDLMERTAMEGIFVDTSLNIVDAFTDLVTADNYNISRFFSPDMDIRLIRLLSEDSFDVVQLESLFMTPYIPTIRRYTKARIVLRSHNLEHVIQQRIAHGERNIIKRPYRQFLAKQLERYEMEVLERVDGVAAISPADAAHFEGHGSLTPVITIPFGVDLKDYPIPDDPDGSPISFFHLGSMDWHPNEEGVRWLLNSVWPRVHKKRPQAKLHLAGNKMPEDLLALNMPNVEIVSRVPDAVAYMQRYAVMVVPLFSAGGMRVKIIEGMAMARTVISTPIGAEGIDVTDGTDVLLARNANEFVERMVSIIDDPSRVRRIGAAAHRLIQERYAEDAIAHDLSAFYGRLLTS
ncbi:MAG: glycosyltransferase [Flavobacteriales bacterium]|nr:glycosyltransferase [Flavobacteriales bacterium]